MTSLLLSRATAIVLGTTLLAFSSHAAASPARAQAPADASDTVTWSVEPADASAATGEAWTELTLDAGQSVTEHMMITNRGGSDVVFRLSAADGYFTDTGRFNMLPGDEPSVDAGTWITIADSAEVAAGESVIVPFQVDVPPNATPGDHPAGVAASIRTGDSTIGVESRVGFRVMTRVRGDLAPALQVIDQTAVYTHSWNPFLPGSLSVSATVVNLGNTRLGASPRITTSGPLGMFTTGTPLAQISELAPGQSRLITAVVPEVWPAFATQVGTTATSLSVDGIESPSGATGSAWTTVSSIPWSHLLLIALLALAVGLLRRRGTSRRKAVHRMVEDAREEGRRMGSATGTGLAVAVIVAIAGGVLSSPAAPSFAATPAAIVVDVTVTPGSPTPRSTPVGTPSTPSTVAPAPRGLPQTGRAVDPWSALAAGISLAAGAASLGARSRRRRADVPRG